ncbi:anthranilate synthase component I family protein [Sporosarcina pasteurii]|uniref:Anthranilate synthase component 1 n=1 Tax=Sporosarcina pasteurii TaxID=1474 RepID=A0A380CLJ2_SPOPA|nr:chorismate-binding protein [Sporosarcina pasteurii]MDS9471891.1 chorismate-binding protein [Sporosarcina pasteurii]QBQ06627.1 anthranilate synthase component I family protein [Sporosarcina pasteurii]SUJ21973.1 Anthranilate synthase component 1 [Sporosarcina pasteurii]
MSVEQKSLRTTMKKINGDSLTPILIFRRLQGKQKFLLESSVKHEDSGRYSFIGMDPIKSYSGSGRKIKEFIYASKKTYVHEGDIFTLLKRLMPRISDSVEFPFAGGAVGYVSYGAGRDLGKTLHNEFEVPEVYLNIFETLIVFDHILNEVTIVRTETDIVKKHENLEELAEQILYGKEVKDTAFTLGEFSCPLSQRQFEDLVKRGQQFIRAGEVEQIVLSRRLEADFEGNPFLLYRKLRKQNPSPYMYYMEIGDSVIVGASPESLVRVTEGTMMTNPIAGTRKRTKDEAENRKLERELKNDPKELMEHDMLVALGREEAKKVCEPGTVQVTKHKEVVHYEHVMHLVSEVEGQLALGLHPLDALTTCLPAGTVTGSPKERAMELIDELEEVHRGIYGGAIGYIGFNGNIDFALTIRTMFIHQGKAYVQAGAGVVEKSEPAAEFMETVNKAKSLLEVVE